MVAGFQRDVQRAASRGVAGIAHGFDLGVCMADGLRETVESPAVGSNEHCSDPRVGSARQSRRSGDEHRFAHRLFVDVAHLFLLPSGL
jgi:hypothetical protein